jgi:cytochrome c-type biogenesis protein CcmE
MNKKERFIIGSSIILVLLVYMGLSGVTSNQYDVSDAVASQDELAGKVIIVNGSMVIGTDKWDGINRVLTFKMTDGKETIDVIYTGDKPDIPPDYEEIQVIATGKFNNNSFEAFKLLTKCPSKYEGNISEAAK